MAVTTQEILIKYKTDISDLQSKVSLIESNLKKTDKAFSSAVTNTTSGFKGLSNAIAPIGGLIAGAFATEQIIAFGKESVKAFQEAELNAKKLQTAVSVNGGLQEDFNNLLDQSKELQKTTIFSDDAIQNAQTAALQFGLTSDEVKKLIPLITDFASATGQDLNTALSSVLRGIEGQGRGLKLYGVNVDAAASRAENLATITDQLTNKFKGQAEIVGNTGAGAVKRYEHQIEELKEELGQKLEPVLILITETAVSFTEAILDAANGVGVIANAIKAGLGDFSGIAEAQLKKVHDLQEAAKKDNAGLVESFAKSFNGLSDGQLQDRLTTYERLLAEAKKQQDELTKSGKAQNQQLNQDIVTYASAALAIRQVNEERKKQAEADKLSLENLKKLTTAQLEALQAQLKQKTDNTSKDAVDNITKILEERRKAGIALAAEQEKQNAARLAAQKAADQELVQLAIDGIKDDFEKRREQAEADFNKFEAQKNADLAAELISQKTRNDLVEAARKKLNDQVAQANADEAEKLAKDDLKNKLDNIDKATTAEITGLQQAFLAKGDFSVEAQKELDAKIADAELKSLEKKKADLIKAGADTTDINKQIADKEIEINKGKNAEIIKQEEETAKKRKEIFDTINEAFETFASSLKSINDGILQAHIDSLTKEQDAVKEAFDAEQAAIEKKVKNRQLTEAQGQKQIEALKAKEVEAEKKNQQAINALKNKQAEQDKLLSIFRIGLTLAEALADLNFFKAAIAAVELAAVVATPIPKFFHGEDYVELGRNKPGRDTIPAMLNEGERVITTENNIKHWDLYESIDKGQLDKYVMKRYIVPVLQEQKKKNDEKKQEDFASSIAKNIPFNGMTYHDADYIRRKGVKLNNTKQISKEIGETVAKEVVRALITERGK